jgi:hypothetical protein
VEHILFKRIAALGVEQKRDERRMRHWMLALLESEKWFQKAVDVSWE